jgi:ABC-type glutathione transport system ATPase component
MNVADNHLRVIREELENDTLERPRTAKPLIVLDGVNLTFDEPVLKGVSLEAREGETLMIAGESGSGKSTILKLILRLLVPESGRIVVLGEDVGALTFQEALDLRKQIGMVFQNAALFDSLSVFDNVAYPLRENTDLDEDGSRRWSGRSSTSSISTRSRSCASFRASCRAECGSASEWPGPLPRTRASSCTTSRRPAWIR